MSNIDLRRKDRPVDGNGGLAGDDDDSPRDAKRGSAWHVAATVAAAVLSALVVVFVASSLGDDIPIGQTTVATPSPPESGAPSPAQVSATPEASSTPQATRTAGISKEQAIAAARAAAPQSADREVRSAQAGPIKDIFPAMDEFEWSRDLPPGRWVWIIYLVTGDAGGEEGSIVFLDYADGSLYEVIDVIG